MTKSSSDNKDDASFRRFHVRKHSISDLGCLGEFLQQPRLFRFCLVRLFANEGHLPKHESTRAGKKIAEEGGKDGESVDASKVNSARKTLP